MAIRNNLVDWRSYAIKLGDVHRLLVEGESTRGAIQKHP